jgi:succinate dehydrogenase / fumarate reductase cytochrome b subunit
VLAWFFYSEGFSHQTVSLAFNCLYSIVDYGPDKCDKTVTDKRPVNLDLGTIDLPLPSIVSITHRITGVLLVAGAVILLWMLDESLASEEGFNAVATLADSVFCKLIVWAVVAALIFHTLAGIKHLIMDLGYGETLEGGMVGAKLVFIVAAILIVMMGAYLW